MRSLLYLEAGIILVSLIAASPVESKPAKNCLVAIAERPRDWSYSTVLKHEIGHCNCPEWNHGEYDASSINPPKACRGKYKGNLIVVPMSLSEVHKICKYSDRTGADACIADMW